MAIFKVEAEGDTMYFEAENKTAAQVRLFSVTGPIPESMLSWTPVEKEDVPEDEEIL